MAFQVRIPGPRRRNRGEDSSALPTSTYKVAEGRKLGATQEESLPETSCGSLYPKKAVTSVTPVTNHVGQEPSTRSVPASRSIQREPIRARIIGQNRTAESDKIEECWHCGASGRCGCAACGAIDGHGRDVAGECRACHGTGHILFKVAQ